MAVSQLPERPPKPQSQPVKEDDPDKKEVN